MASYFKDTALSTLVTEILDTEPEITDGVDPLVPRTTVVVVPVPVPPVKPIAGTDDTTLSFCVAFALV